MKKLINVTLALMLVLSSSVVAFATETNQVPPTETVVSQVADDTDKVTCDQAIVNQDGSKPDKVSKKAMTAKEAKQPREKLFEAERAQLQLLQKERLQIKSQINTLKLDILSIKQNKDSKISKEVKISIQDNIKEIKAINEEIKALHSTMKVACASLKDAQKINDADTRKALMQQIIALETELNAKISEKADTIKILVNIFHSI